MAKQKSTGFSVPPSAIVNQIKTLLKERYKEGFPIIKEIIQNANDGGATCLDIGITQGLKGVTHPLLRDPALFFVNNGSFQDSDAQAIGWFGVDFNAGNTAKIGKFGLGQKSIFHFCEAFFYIAHSHQLSDPHDYEGFLNPWADPTNFEQPDNQHPDWQQLEQSDRDAVIKYLHNNELLTSHIYDKYFILWVPLRSSSAKRHLLPKHYDEQTIKEHLPADMETRIATLMPMLRSLQTVRYWQSDEENRLQKIFQVCLADCNQRFIYPKTEEIAPVETVHLLHGQVKVNDCSVDYTGHEVILPTKTFDLLIPSSSKPFTDFWTTLKENDFWPQRSTQDESGIPQSVPDKAIPHCGVIISRCPAKGSGRLTVQWAVFLPLSEESLVSTEFEQISGNGDWDYTLLLHGYFFLDSGRQGITALNEIYSGQVSLETPNSDDLMMRLWNAILATEGTVSLILTVLKEFCDRNSLSEQAVANLCKLLKQSKLFTQKSLQDFIYRQHCWVYRLKSKQKDWQLIDPAVPILTIPSIPNWEAFPELSNIAETHCLILTQSPNLIPSCKPNIWTDSNIVAVIDKLSINQVFKDETQLEFLTSWLRSFPAPLSNNVQISLKTKLKKVLSLINYEELPQQWTKNIVSLLDEHHWFSSDCRNNKLLSELNQKPVSILFLPNILAPQRQTSYELTSQDAGVLISTLSNNNNSHLTYQIISAVSLKDFYLFRNQVNSIKFIPGFNCRIEKKQFHTPQEIDWFSKQKILFLESNMSRKVALYHFLKYLPQIRSQECMPILSMM